jgi:hypothetical protein
VDLKMEGTRHIIATVPTTKAPEGDGPEYSEPVRWYWSGPGEWTTSRKKAREFDRPSDAVAQIRAVRSRICAVDILLEPVHGTGSMYRPA